MTVRATIAGGSGYAGGELLRLLLSHPRIEVSQASSERLGGKPVQTVHPHLRGRTDLRFVPRSVLEPADVLFLALAHGESSREIEHLRHLAPLVIDLSADFRLRDARAYPQWYGWEHPCPQLLPDAVYGLAELHRGELRQASLIATGGCLASAAILGLRPLAAQGLIDAAMPLVVEAKVGSSAAGAQPNPASHHPQRSGEMRSFAPTGHRHTAEVAQELGLTSSADDRQGGVAFSATAVEAVRGVLVTAHAYLREDLSDRDLWGVYRTAYRDEPFVRIVKEARGIHRYPEPKLLTGTNFCDVAFERDRHSRRVVVLSALDNLVKGAAGQAVQALNVRRGWDERLGLDVAAIHPI